ncbi:hypothetical protein BKA62DRAFT_413861 [Auriculariales sp. MPI-PUGE-AT-0066]|nr:hypothetical protein BKA62DRAFT_413861 [Auriculariales sp. MPI-PUGE-AT-0066]
MSVRVELDLNSTSWQPQVVTPLSQNELAYFQDCLPANLDPNSSAMYELEAGSQYNLKPAVGTPRASLRRLEVAVVLYVPDTNAARPTWDNPKATFAGILVDSTAFNASATQPCIAARYIWNAASFSTADPQRRVFAVLSTIPGAKVVPYSAQLVIMQDPSASTTLASKSSSETVPASPSSVSSPDSEPSASLLVPAIVVPLILVLVLAAALFWARHRRRRRQRQYEHELILTAPVATPYVPPSNPTTFQRKAFFAGPQKMPASTEDDDDALHELRTAMNQSGFTVQSLFARLGHSSSSAATSHAVVGLDHSTDGLETDSLPSYSDNSSSRKQY